MSLERELAEGRAQRYDVLAIDAFSSDSIPVHLITLEAARVYLRHLRDEDSVLAFHISNRYLDLEPVVRGIARKLNLTLRIEASCKDRDKGVYYARWILLRRNTGGVVSDDGEDVQLWTDDFSNLYAVLKPADD